MSGEMFTVISVREIPISGEELESMRGMEKGVEGVLEGGPGSGYFGHAGRPGEVGGSGPGKGSEETFGGARAAALAGEIFAKASRAEPVITASMKKIAKETGTELDRLAFAKKTKESVQRKIADYMRKEPNLTPEQAAGKIQDYVRYTVIADHENFGNGVRDCNKAMMAAGYELKRVKNYFDPKTEGYDEYHGINCKYYKDAKLNITFEVQYHTRQSVALAERNHAIYNKQRIARNPRTVVNLSRQITQNWRHFVNPPKSARLFFSSRALGKRRLGESWLARIRGRLA
jgi:hypothetical protein